MSNLQKGGMTLKFKMLTIMSLSSVLLLGACSDKEEEVAPLTENELELITANVDGAEVTEITDDESAITGTVLDYGNQIASKLESIYFLHNTLKETEEELIEEIQKQETLTDYVNYIRNSPNYRDPYIVKEIRYNEESEKLYKKGDFYYYQVTFEADVKMGIRNLQVDDTFSLRIGQQNNGELFVQDFVHVDGHTIPEAGPEITEENFKKFTKEKLTKILQYSDTFETTNSNEALEALKNDFQYEGDIMDVMQSQSFTNGSKKTLKKVVFDDSQSVWSYANVSDEIIEQSLNGQVPQQFIGVVGLKFEENGKVGDQFKAYDFKMIFYQPGYDEGDFTYKIWKTELIPTDGFDWETYSSD